MLGYLRRKRKRDTAMDLLSPIEVLKRIKELNVEHLWTPGVRTELPFPGLDDPGDRPGKSISFIGSEAVKNLLESWNHHLVLTGPKGSGKSCLLRALACVLYRRAQKVVCIWNVERARRALVPALKQALQFTYLEGPVEVLDQINKLASLGDVELFLAGRKNELCFIFDGAEVWDVVTSIREPRVGSEMWDLSKTQLFDILLPFKVLWGLSPRADALVDFGTEKSEAGRLLEVVGLLSGWEQAPYDEFMKESVLGSLMEHHQADIDYYAGRHPWLLTILDDCCHWHLQVVCPSYAINRPTNAELAEFLHDSEDWNEVCNKFIEDHRIGSIWAYHSFQRVAQKQAWELPCYDLEKMMKYDPRFVYANPEGNTYCSDFIRSRYVENFRKLEAIASPSILGPWLGYCDFMTTPGNIMNWAETGLLVQRLAEDVIPRKGIRINGILDMPSLQTRRFLKPGLSIGDVPAPGTGYYYAPIQCNYPHVDAVIVWTDAAGQQHLVGLQFTTSLAQHIHSAGDFMDLSILELWIRSILADSTSGKWKCHFAFVSLDAKDVETVAQKTQTFSGGVSVGKVGYELHCIRFQEAFVGRVEASVITCFNKMVSLREQYVQIVTPPAAQQQAAQQQAAQQQAGISRAAAKNMSRKSLEKIAIAGGVGDPSRKKYSNKDKLIDELKKLKLL